MEKLTVYIVDDDDSVRDSLAFMLESYDFNVLGFNSGEKFIKKCPITQPGCVVLDVKMPGLRGQQVHEFISEQESPLSVIYLTGHGDVPMAVEALKLGAIDFFQKPVNGDLLAEAVTNALNKSLQNQKRLAYLADFNLLTGREKEVCQLIANGYKNKQISEALFIAIRTVEIHRSNLMRRLKVKSVTQLMHVYNICYPDFSESI